MTRSLLWIFAALFMAGCGASFPVPNERIASSEAAVRGADEVGARNDPRAALHLKLAQEDITKAKALVQDGDNQRADTVLLRGQTEAELAISLAREAVAKAEAQQAAETAAKIKAGGQ